MKLLDTDVLIDYWRGTEAVEAYFEATAATESFVSTTISLKELAVGRALQGPLDPAEFDATFGWLTFLPFRSAHAFEAAALEADLRSRADGNQDRVNALAADVLIAGVARAEGATVVTRNDRDFSTFEGVDVEGY